MKWVNDWDCERKDQRLNEWKFPDQITLSKVIWFDDLNQKKWFLTTSAHMTTLKLQVHVRVLSFEWLYCRRLPNCPNKCKHKSKHNSKHDFYTVIQNMMQTCTWSLRGVRFRAEAALNREWTIPESWLLTLDSLERFLRRESESESWNYMTRPFYRVWTIQESRLLTPDFLEIFLRRESRVLKYHDSFLPCR